MSTNTVGDGATMTHKTKVKLQTYIIKPIKCQPSTMTQVKNEHSKTVYNNSDLLEIEQIYKRT